MEDGTEKKFQRKGWLEHLSDPPFRERVIQIIEQDVIKKFSDRTGNAADYYNLKDEDS